MTERCAHCATPIVERATRVTDASGTYCCNSCASAATGRTTTQGGSECAHCGVVIVDRAAMSERGGQVFCCANCAAVEAPTARGARS